MTVHLGDTVKIVHTLKFDVILSQFLLDELVGIIA